MSASKGQIGQAPVSTGIGAEGTQVLSPRERLPAIPKPYLPPPPPSTGRGGWYVPERDGTCSVTGKDLALAGLPTSTISYVLARLGEAARRDPELDCPERLLPLAALLAEAKPESPTARFRIQHHAVLRYVERVAPGQREREARCDMIELANVATFTREPPEWMRLDGERQKVRGGYLEVAEGICFPVHEGAVKTVITRELVETVPLRPDPFPTIRPERPDPCWPERRYVVEDEGGLIQCRAIVDGELVVTTGRNSHLAWKALGEWFSARGQRERFEAGQEDYNARPARREAQERREAERVERERAASARQ